MCGMFGNLLHIRHIVVEDVEIALVYKDGVVGVGDVGLDVQFALSYGLFGHPLGNLGQLYTSNLLHGKSPTGGGCKG